MASAAGVAWCPRFAPRFWALTWVSPLVPHLLEVTICDLHSRIRSCSSRAFLHPRQLPFQFSLDLRRHGIRRLKHRNHNQDRENVSPAQAVEILTYLKSRL